MEVHHGIEDFAAKKLNTILTIGTFDGVHIGHKKIIERLNELKKAGQAESAILTFYPHPRSVLRQDGEIKMLTTPEEKITLLGQYKLDHLIIEPFTEALSGMTASRFVEEILVKRLKVKKLVIGHDHRFGKNREGDFDKLVELGDLFGYAVEEIPSQEIENIAVSSTKIRKALESGEIDKANRYLGYPYLLSGEVIRGKGIGRTISFPTINLKVHEDYKLIPKIGVYIVKTVIKNKCIHGLLNIGFRPTLNGTDKSVEVYLLGIDEELYGSHMQIELLHRLRDEVRFESIEELKDQISKDVEKARDWLKKTFKTEIQP